MTAVAQTNTQARNNVRPHKEDNDWDPDLYAPMTRKDANSNVLPERAGQVFGRPATFSVRGGRGGTLAAVPSANTAASRPISKPTTDDSDWAACPRPIVPARNGTAALPMPYTAHRVVSVATTQINNGMETRSLRDLTYAAARARAEVATAVRSPANSSDAAPQLDTEHRFGTAATARDDNSTCVPPIRAGFVRPGAGRTATRTEPATAARQSANTSDLASQLDTERRYGTAATARDNNSTFVLPTRSALALNPQPLVQSQIQRAVCRSTLRALLRRWTPNIAMAQQLPRGTATALPCCRSELASFVRVGH
ncbi:hypothetical protein AAVH_22527 [Aphelenchoides avenae]|nr:hypothetical protein AAVH_22527 [Aphelenchus avenae]